MEFFNFGKGLALAALIAASTTGLAGTKKIPVIGIDNNGNEVITMESASSFKGKLIQAHRVVSGSSIGALETASKNGNDFKLQGMEVGVGIFGEIGLGDVVKASAEPTLIFVYARKDNGRKTR